VDEERINKRLALLRETALLLSASLPRSEEAYRKADRLTRDATERRLQVVSESEIDIMRTLYKDLGRRVVGDEESLMDALSDQLGKKTIEQAKRRRALRNKLVHAYLDIDQAEVYREASELGDVEEFEKAVAKLVKPA
jgi:uncharacterized protein YutE (UPF0331/DUF86 family)